MIDVSSQDLAPSEGVCPEIFSHSTLCYAMKQWLRPFIESFLPRPRREYIYWHNAHFGRLSAIKRLMHFLVQNADLDSVSLPGYREPIYLRTETPHDKNIFSQVFHKMEYDIDIGYPKTIIDAGAHVGFASIYFATLYPKARILALEPERSNFEILKINTRNYDNISIANKGLWSHCARLTLENPDTDNESSFRLIETESSTGIPAIGVADAIDLLDTQVVDLLKMDIEGAEKEVLTNNTASWIDSVRTLVVEPHDRFRPGCLAAINRIQKQYDFTKRESGENTVLSKY